MTKTKLSSLVKMLVLFTAFWMGAASSARADIVFDAAASGSGSGGPVSWSHTVGNGNNRILVVSLGINRAHPYPPADSVTYAGQALTQVLLNNTSNPISEIWTLIAPPVGTANVVVTHPEGAEMVGGSVSFFGVDEAMPVRDRNSTRSDISWSGTASTSVASDTGDVVVSLGVIVVSSGTITPAAGQTQRWSQAISSHLKSVGSTKSGESGSTTVSYDYTTDSTTIVVSAISLIPEQLTLAEMVENLTDTVQSYNLHRGIENALLAKLYAALESLSANNVEDARGSLNAFLNQVAAQTGKALTQVQADELRAAAQVILEALG